MTKGKALLAARKVLGPSAHVRYDDGLPLPCKIGTFDERGWIGVAVGKSWGGALEALPKSEAARAWTVKREAAANEIKAAKASLSATISRILERAKGKLSILDLIRDMRKAA